MGLFFVVIIVSITNRKRKMLEININARFAPGELMEELEEILDSFPSKLFHPKWYVKKWHLIFIFTWNIIYFIYPDHVQVQAREHGQALLECSVTGKPAPSVTWYKDGQPLVEVVNKLIWKRKRNKHSNVPFPSKLNIFLTFNVYWYYFRFRKSLSILSTQCTRFMAHPQSKKITYSISQKKRKKTQIFKRNLYYFSAQVQDPKSMALAYAKLELDCVSPQDAGVYECRASNGQK